MTAKPCKIVSLLAAALLLAGCAAGPSTASKSDKTREEIRQELLAAFDGLSPEEIAKAGDAAAARGESERALFIYNQVLVLEPSASVWYRIGLQYAALGNKPQAWRAYATALELDPEFAPAHEEIGLLHLSMKQETQAVTHLERATELDPARWRAYNALGVIADVNKDYLSAIRNYDAALAANPESAMLLNNLGYSHYLAGNLAEAESFLRMAVGMDPRYQPAVANLGLIYARQRDYQQAVDILGRVLEQRQAYNDVGFIAYHNGDFDEAAWLLTEAIRVSPTYYEAARRNLRRVQQAMENQVVQPPAAAPPAVAADRPAGEGGAAPEIPRDMRSVESVGLNVRSGANLDAPVVVQLRGGQQVEVIYELGGWAFIEYRRPGDEDSVSGWVKAQYLSAAEIDPAGPPAPGAAPEGLADSATPPGGLH